MKVKYVAFLRGINVGGHVTVKMEALRKAFSSLGFTNVSTLLNSGNVIFETQETKSDFLQKRIEEKLERTFGRPIDVLLRTVAQLQKLIDRNPFKNISVTPQTRLYITFLSEKSVGTLKIPYKSEGEDVHILSASKDEVVSVITLSTGKNTTDLMKIIEREFGKKVTTRNWNTVLKVAK